MGNPRVPLTFETTFHIYNHAVGEDKFFREAGHYHLFMCRFIKYIFPVAEVLTYNLIPNHFHFLLRIRPYKELKELFKNKVQVRLGRPTNKLDEISLVEKLMSEQFSHCFNSYAQTYNKKYNRWGSLFKESFQRKVVNSDEYLKQLVCYIHNNAVRHKLVSEISNWKYSSYNDIFDSGPSLINRQEIIDLFHDKSNFEIVHRNYADFTLPEEHPALA